ncbi:hypothetical protein D3C77_750210 [compost metagenome]
MQHLWRFMHLLANTVAAILAHHAVTRRLGMGLHGMADITQRCPRAHLLDAFP